MIKKIPGSHFIANPVFFSMLCMEDSKKPISKIATNLSKKRAGQQIVDLLVFCFSNQ